MSKIQDAHRHGDPKKQNARPLPNLSTPAQGATGPFDFIQGGVKGDLAFGFGLPSHVLLHQPIANGIQGFGCRHAEGVCCW